MSYIIISLARCRAIVLALILLSLTCATSLPADAQSLSSFDRERGRMMLNQIKGDIKKHYYDTSFRGVDLENLFKVAEEKIKQASSNGQVFGIIAQAMLDLGDSHTYFIPPSRAMSFDYGWRMRAIGEKCFVTEVKPGSDAEAKGLKVGDAVLWIDGYTPVRENLWKLEYLYYALKPQPGMRVYAQSPGGEPRQLDLLAKVQERKRRDLTNYVDYMDLVREGENEDKARVKNHRYHSFSDSVFVWKMPRFDLSENEVAEMMTRVRRHKALILDLRGNPGGLVETLALLAGHLFDKGVKIADLKGRGQMKPILAKRNGDEPFKGKLVVLVDSRSASSAEVIARLVQIEKRGTVIGDRTAGKVMRSKHHEYQVGIDTVAFYGASITDADVLMTDGKSLESTGVIPDEVLLPSAEDLAAKRDAVLARAVTLLGVEINPEKAGSLFPIAVNK